MSRSARRFSIVLAVALLALLIPAVRAQEIQIVSRPLSGQEVTDLGLTNTTQTSGGALTVGLGMPAYLEAQVLKFVPNTDPDVPIVVTQVVWSLDSQPGSSTVDLTNSPLSLAVPIYDGGEREDFQVVGRTLLRPDAVGDYTVSVQVDGTTNGTPISLAATNKVTGGTYIGVNDAVCQVCHAADIAEYETTGHATFFTRMINGETGYYKASCIECHTVGFDETAGADNGGFDDVALDETWTFPTNLVATNWASMSPALQNKANIQCENCHGPASQHKLGGFAGVPGDRKISVSLSSGNCAQCHDAMTHHVKNFEWNQTLHATGAVYYVTQSGGSCKACHSGLGFIASVDDDYASYTDVVGTGEEGISCAACHDPHSDDGPHQLRVVPDVTLKDGSTTITNAGAGMLCMQCHKSRRDADDYVTEWHDHYGPHHGPQADMLVGANAIEFGQDIDSSDAHAMIEDTCVHCHMQELEDDPVPAYSNAFTHAGGHTFKMTWDGGTPGVPGDDVDVAKACAECHGSMVSFDAAGHDYDGDGMVEGLQTEIGDLLEELALLLPPVGSNAVDTSSNALYSATLAERQGAYNYLFVEEDGSHGIHNPKYAAGILRAAITNLGGSVEAPPVPSDHAYVRIASRPLTTQEVEDHGLTNPVPAQLSGGLCTIALGAPAYLEAQALKVVPGSDPDVPIVVTQVVWSLDGQPLGSSADLTNSPLGGGVLMYDGGEREQYNLADRQVLVPDLPGDYMISVEFNGTTNGAPISVQAYKKIVGARYQGWSACATCHDGTPQADKITGWEGTGHASFFARMVNGETGYYKGSCISCHMVGFDETAGADNGGFDDVADDLGWTFPATLAANNWDDMSAPLQAKANIQCENCHGPGGEHAFGGLADRISTTLSSGNCGQCHDALTHHVKNFEWNQTLHATGAVYYVTYAGGSCKACHSGIGFIASVDDDYASYTEVSGTGLEGITCAACHDPHSAEGHHQVRDVPDVTLKDGVTTITDDAGTGLLCMRCHQSRRNAATYTLAWADHYGPHHGPQADMLAGANAVEYGQDIARSRHMLSVPDTCVHCHMQELEDDPVAAYSNAFTHAGGHVFSMEWDGGTPIETDDVDLAGGCVSCHGSVDEFDFGGEDYDRDGTVEGVQTEIEDLMEELAMLLPPVGVGEVDVSSNAMYNATVPELQAAYNYLFVEEDGSHGVHNPKYAAGILRESITSLTTGHDDVDGDGLDDNWEILHFGNTWSQNGQGDPDDDGVPNSMEEGAGTDPNKKDTDDDGYSDFAELSAGSSPLLDTEVPDVGVSMLYRALELVSVLGPGTNYQVQAIDDLGGTWTNDGEVIVGSGQELQHFISLRDLLHRFYRVVVAP